MDDTTSTGPFPFVAPGAGGADPDTAACRAPHSLGQRNERPAGRHLVAAAQRDGSRLCPRGPTYMRCR